VTCKAFLAICFPALLKPSAVVPIVCANNARLVCDKTLTVDTVHILLPPPLLIVVWPTKVQIPCCSFEKRYQQAEVQTMGEAKPYHYTR